MDKYEQFQANRNRSGVDILASIMQYCTPSTNRHIMGKLSKTMPKIVEELKQSVRTFEDLAYADARGMQKLLKLVSTKDLALALRGSSQAIIQNIAINMSKNKFSDLKTEIAMTRNAHESEILEARDKIMDIVMEQIQLNELYINRPGSKLRRY